MRILREVNPDYFLTGGEKSIGGLESQIPPTSILNAHRSWLEADDDYKIRVIRSQNPLSAIYRYLL